jgi:type I restriction enzyme S subunit
VSEWTISPIEDLCEAVVDCVNKTAPTVPGPTPYKMIRTTNVRFGRVDTSDVRYVDAATYEKWTRRIVPRRDDVILTREAPLGEVGIVRSDDQIFLGQRTVAYRADRSVSDPRFLAYALQGPEVQASLRSLGSGSTVEHLRVPDCVQIPITHPHVAAQRRIGDVLGSIDDLIENNRRRIVVLEEMAQTIYREWFVHFRYPGHESATMVDSPLGPIPEGWERVKTSDLIHRGMLEIGDGYRAKNSELIGDDSDLPFVRVANIKDGSLVLTSCDYLPFAYVHRLKGKVSRPGDCVISMKGTVGRSAYIGDDLRALVYSPQVSYWRSLDYETIAPTYLYAFIRSAEFVRQCALVKGSTDMADYVNLADQRKMTLLVPLTGVMAAFDDAAGTAVRLVGMLHREVHELSATRDLLLPKLVTGEIDVSNLDLDSLIGVAS